MVCGARTATRAQCTSWFGTASSSSQRSAAPGNGSRPMQLRMKPRFGRSGQCTEGRAQTLHGGVGQRECVRTIGTSGMVASLLSPLVYGKFLPWRTQMPPSRRVLDAPRGDTAHTISDVRLSGTHSGRFPVSRHPKPGVDGARRRPADKGAMIRLIQRRFVIRIRQKNPSQ